MEKICSRFFWRNMNVEIREFVQSCDKCQKMNPKFNKVAATLRPVPVKAEVWHQVSVPFSVHASYSGWD